MSTQPHSLLDAAKLVADVAGLEWSVAHRYYRDLQTEPGNGDNTAWLPKSLGRNIWYAHPNYIARLLIAVGMAATPTEACQSVSFVSQFTPDGRTKWQADSGRYHVESRLALYLTKPSQAHTLDRIEFDPELGKVRFVSTDGKAETFAKAGSADENLSSGTIYQLGVIPGSVISGLGEAIRWRVDSPLKKTPQGAVDPEA